MDHEKYEIVKCAGGIVKNYNGKIALVLMDDVKVWDFPKGGIEKNESEIDTAKREIYEETGLRDIELIKKLDNYVRPAANGNQVIMDIAMFLFKTRQEKISPTKNDIKEAKWVRVDDMMNFLTLQESKNYFKIIFNEL